MHIKHIKQDTHVIDYVILRDASREFLQDSNAHRAFTPRIVPIGFRHHRMEHCAPFESSASNILKMTRRCLQGLSFTPRTVPSHQVQAPRKGTSWGVPRIRLSWWAALEAASEAFRPMRGPPPRRSDTPFPHCICLPTYTSDQLLFHDTHLNRSLSSIRKLPLRSSHTPSPRCIANIQVLSLLLLDTRLK